MLVTILSGQVKVKLDHVVCVADDWCDKCLCDSHLTELTSADRTDNRQVYIIVEDHDAVLQHIGQMVRLHVLVASSLSMSSLVFIVPLHLSCRLKSTVSYKVWRRRLCMYVLHTSVRASIRASVSKCVRASWTSISYKAIEILLIFQHLTKL